LTQHKRIVFFQRLINTIRQDPNDFDRTGWEVMTGLFRRKNFVFLWLGQLISSYGDRLNQMACVALVTTLMPTSTKAVSYLFAASHLPVVLFGPVLGVYVDRWNPKKCMVYCDIIRGALVLTIPLAIVFWPPQAGGWLWFLCGIVFVVGTLTRVFVPARLSVMPVILPPNKLMAGNGVLTGSILVATVLGLASGDILLGIVGQTIGFMIDAGTFFASALFIFLLVLPKRSPALMPNGDPVEHRDPHFWRELMEGARVLIGHREVFFAVSSLCMLMGGAGAIFILITVYIKQGFPMLFSGGAFGVFLGTVGIGAITGAALVSWYGSTHPREKLLGIGFFLTGCLCLPFCLLLIRGFHIGEQGDSQATLYAFLLFDAVAFLLGMFVAPVMITCDTWLQEVVPEHIRGRVFGTKETFLSLSFIIGNIVIGHVADPMLLPNREKLIVGLSSLLMVMGFFWAVLVHKHGAGKHPAPMK